MSHVIPKRLTKEIEYAKSAAMEDQGIFYEYDEVNMMSGNAMIVGPEGTPYEGCLLCFAINYPGDYPFSSPTVRITTSDGVTRFHPNLYIDGKVCLSILGTWSGPKWAPAMSISTVLTTIRSILEPNPITNEPGHERLRLEDADHRAKDYAELVRFRLVSHTFRRLHAWKTGALPVEWTPFKDVLEIHGDTFLANLERSIEREAAKEDIHYPSVLYRMSGTTGWKSLAEISRVVRKIA
jgi:ubiquitin-protein ligase